jgi:iron complex outermembrane recepter protein
MNKLATQIKRSMKPLGYVHSAVAAPLLLAGLVALPAAVQAQEKSADNMASSNFTEEVLVTARKRAESMFDIPISINVVSESTIENLGAQDFTDLLGSVPSLTAYQNGPGRTRLSIRGVANGGGNDNDTQNQETVGIYLDEIPISMGAMNPEIGLFDLDRVEVLRGPQGTLYGAGSMTGTIRLISKKPNLSEFEGKVETNYSTINEGSDGHSLKS